MKDNIYLPNNEQMGKMIGDAWKTFKKQCAESGLPFKDKRLEEFAQDMFVGGYCAGYNDCLGIIRGQIEAIDMVSNVFNGKMP